MKKDWIKEAYRKWFNRLNEEVPEDVWKGIEDELDVDEVWDKVSAELDSPRRLSPRRWMVRAAALLLPLLSALAAYWYLTPSRDNRELPLAAERSLPGQGTSLPDRETALSDPETQRGKREAPVAGQGSLSEGRGTAPLTGQEAPVAGQGQQTDGQKPLLAGQPPATSVPVPREVPSSGNRDLAGEINDQRLAAEGVRPMQTVQPRQVMPEEDLLAGRAEPAKLPEPEMPANLLAGVSAPEDPETPEDGHDPFIRLQRIGVVSAYNNTWMLNHETFSGLRPSTLTATTFTYGSGAGINAGFLVKGKHKIGAELYLSSPAGQGYRQYIEARYQSRSIDLDYYKMQLYYQLPVFSGKGDILAGAYASYLKRGREKIAGEARTVGRFYRSIDYGIMAGYQFNLPVNERLLLQPGIRVNYGLPNIFRGNQHIPENFLRTHNAAAGLYLGVSYRLY